MRCRDFPGAPGCCSSCHEDEDYGYPLLDDELPDGTRIDVCCSVYRWLEETGRVVTP